MKNELLYRIALMLVPGVGAVQSKILLEHFGNAENIFKAKTKELSALENMGVVRAKAITEFENFKQVEEELKFIDKYKIEVLFISDEKYPKRLLNCYDCPTILFYKGNANLNQSKIISIIGTRINTSYGKEITEHLVAGLKEQNVIICSGLAFGIDAIAHKAALQNEIATIGVLAHGLHTIYPTQHKSLAKQMLENGALITEFRNGDKPDKHNFPKRNRIVAGIADATVVIETALKGGSMITAELANNYNRDVFAFPGKATDNKSEGCNYLIKNNKATLITGADDLIEEMGWQQKKQPKKQQRELFIELSADEKIIVDILKQKNAVHIDEIYLQSNLNSSAVAGVILNLELQNIISSQPGKMYSLI